MSPNLLIFLLNAYGETQFLSESRLNDFLTKKLAGDAILQYEPKSIDFLIKKLIGEASTHTHTYIYTCTYT